MKERLIIENFGGIQNIDIYLNKINVFIGQQATGKSICAKLLYYFKKFDSEFINAVEKEISQKELDRFLINKFIDYFPTHTYPKEGFKLRYEINNYFIEVKRNNGNKIELSYSDEYKQLFDSFKKLYKKIKETRIEKNIFSLPIEIENEYHESLKENIGENAGFNQFFIPAGRSFFANLQKSIYSFLSNNKTIDPFIIEFGSFYERIKDVLQGIVEDHITDTMIEKIISGKYQREKGDDFLIHPDGRKINIAYSSSGQQELLPLILILKVLNYVRFSTNGTSIYIEEPEAHIFPNAQKLIVELITYVFNNSKSNYQFFITTHSPYILTSFNNLILAGSIEKDAEETNKKELYQIIAKEFVLKPDSINAYCLADGHIDSLIDPETGLIAANHLDTVSNDISIEFDNLLNLL